MAGKPKKVVDKNDPRTFSQPGAFEAIRTLAEQNGWTSGFGVAMTAAHFEADGGRLPNTILAIEIAAAKAEIVARGLAQKEAKQVEAKKEANGGRVDVRDRMPNPDDVKSWDLGRWKGLFPIRVLLERYPEGNLTSETLDDLAAELKAKKEADAAVVDERPDPDPLVAEIKMPCAAKRHKGENPLVYAGQRNKVERGEDDKLHIRTHSGSQEAIVSGDFLKLDGFEGPLPPGVIRVEEAGKVLFGRRYCVDCREGAYTDFRARKELPEKLPNGEPNPDWIPKDARLTFYTVEGLRVIARSEAGGSQARDEEGSSSKRLAFGVGSRKGGGFHNWRTAEGRGQRGR